MTLPLSTCEIPPPHYRMLMYLGVGLMVRVGVANRTITPPCPHVHTLIFCDFQIFFVSAFYEASAPCIPRNSF
jgi:hypothetical protein